MNCPYAFSGDVYSANEHLIEKFYRYSWVNFGIFGSIHFIKKPLKHLFVDLLR